MVKVSENIELYHGDCLDFLSRLNEESIDLIVTDPPYPTTKRGNANSMGGYWKEELACAGKIFVHNDIAPIEYMREFYRVLKDGGIAYVMTNNKNLQELLNAGTKCGFRFIKNLIWQKPNKICGTYYMGCYEYICLFRKGKDNPINNPSTPDIISVPFNKLKDNSNRNLHNTEKPVALMQILIENSSNRGDIVLDPFMGSGTTGVACINTNRRFIGIEKEEKYFDITKQRIQVAKDEEECQFSLLDIPPHNQPKNATQSSFDFSEVEVG